MLDIALLPDEYVVAWMPEASSPPDAMTSGVTEREVVSVTWNAGGLSIICPATRAPAEAIIETPWRCLRVAGPLDLALTGILASLVGPLADARVNIVAFSTYDTDYVLVPAVRLAEAIGTLTNAGHRVLT